MIEKLISGVSEKFL